MTRMFNQLQKNALNYNGQNKHAENQLMTFIYAAEEYLIN